MSYNTELQGNNQELQEILAEVNNLPEAGVNESTVVAKISAKTQHTFFVLFNYFQFLVY